MATNPPIRVPCREALGTALTPHPEGHGGQRPAPRGRRAPNVARGAPVRVLEDDPELAAELAGPDLVDAERVAVARSLQIGTGPWPASLRGPEPGAFGFLVMEGLLGVRTETDELHHLDVLGAGDLTRPWLRLDGATVPVGGVSVRALTPVHLAVLDGAFARRVSPWPQVAAALMDRLVLRARRLSYQIAVLARPRVDERLLLMLWHFADRWGRVTPDGVRLELPLAHHQLAEIVGARRPSVTTALGGLEERGLVSRSGHYLLHGAPPRAFAELRVQAGLSPAPADPAS